MIKKTKNNKNKKKTKKMKKISLLGGSFNPIHNDHLKIIKYLLKKKLTDEVWLVPCKKHAFDKSLASAKHRVKMIKLTARGIKKVKICYIELRSTGKNYTLDTVKKLKNKYNYQFFMIIGSDILHEFKKWHKYKQLMKELAFIVFKRKNYRIKKFKDMKIAYLIEKEASNISSTEIRKRAEEGKSLKNLIPISVENYIKKEGLYK